MSDSPVAEAIGLRKVFRNAHARSETVAVADVSFSIAEGESLAIVGESGSGKTTIARMLIGLERATEGTIHICGREYGTGHIRTSERRRRGRELQIVFQDPYTSLDPHQRVGSCIAEVVRQHFGCDGATCAARVAELLDQVGLQSEHAQVRPHKLSGGQRQRVAIARALAARPRVLILDEAVAALDVSVQAQVLNLLADIRETTSISYLFISHDLAVVRQVSDRALVLHRGTVVESGPTAAILDHPSHEYTRKLRAAVPSRAWTPEQTQAVVTAEHTG
jgi:peptide/nickel transport system ATP-binding protein